MQLSKKILLALSLTVVSPALAEDLYFRSAKVSAITRGSQSTLEVELAPLLKVLGYSSQEVQGVTYLFDTPSPGQADAGQAPNGALVVFRDKAIEAATDDQGHLLVNLSSFCSATGLRERRSGNRAEVSKPLSSSGGTPSGELLTNPVFNSNLKGWTVVGSAAVHDAGNNAAGKLYSARLEHHASISQEIPTVAGKMYEVRVEYYGKLPERIIQVKADSQVLGELPGTGKLLTTSFIFRGSPKGTTRLELSAVSRDKHFVNIHSVRVRALDP
jgi:hypothetical protein